MKENIKEEYEIRAAIHCKDEKEKEQQSLKGIEKESVNPKKLFLYDTN